MAAAIEAVRAEWEPTTLLAEIQRSWPSAVGEGIAQHAIPTSERGGVVTVSCSGSVWAQELDLMGPSVLEALNRGLNGGEVRRLRCVTAPPPA